MKNILLILLFYPSIIFGQVGFGFKNLKESLVYMNETEKKLLTDCAKTFNLEIDSLTSIEDIYDKSVIMTCSILASVRSNYPFENTVTKEYCDRAIYFEKGKTILDKPRYMIFVMRDKNGSQVTLQKYY